jgi:hypothetical protein
MQCPHRQALPGCVSSIVVVGRCTQPPTIPIVLSEASGGVKSTSLSAHVVGVEWRSSRGQWPGHVMVIRSPDWTVFRLRRSAVV